MSIMSVLFASCVLGMAAAQMPNQVPLTPTEGVFAAGDWTYQFVILGKGTPDERSVGKLSWKGKEVVGIPFARLTTEIGEFQWAGYKCDSEHVGWYRIDPRKKYARWIRVRIDQSRDGPVWVTTKE
jgi:hypothetical protein